MEGHRNHQGHGREGSEIGPFPARDPRREGLRGEVQAVNTDEGHVFHVGNLAAP